MFLMWNENVLYCCYVIINLVSFYFLNKSSIRVLVHEGRYLNHLISQSLHGK